MGVLNFNLRRVNKIKELFGLVYNVNIERYLNMR